VTIFSSPLELFTQAWMTWALARCGIKSTQPRKIDATATAVRLNDIVSSQREASIHVHSTPHHVSGGRAPDAAPSDRRQGKFAVQFTANAAGDLIGFVA
jgi:hypothetical protein